MKKWMKNIVVYGLSLLLVVGLMSGCGKKGGAATETADGKIAISVMISGADAAEATLMQNWKKAYEAKNEGISIQIKNFTGDYTQAMTANVQSEKLMPDIMWTTGDTHVAWSDAGVFVNLKDMIAADSSIDLGDFYEEIVNTTHKNSADDGIYFMPRDYNKCILYINKVMFREAGFSEDEIANLKEGWDYNKFLDVCARLRKAMDENVNPDAGLRSNSVPLDARMDFNASYVSFIKHFGGDFVENGKVDFTSDKNISAYAQIYDLIDKGYIAESGKKSSATFTTLSAAMAVNVRPSLPSMPTTDNYDIDFLPLPLDTVGVGCSGYAITASAAKRVSESSYNKDKKSNQEYAYDFLSFIVSEEGQKIGCETGNIVPVLKSLADDPSWHSYLSADKNHAAFVSHPEKDFSLRLFKDFSAQDTAVLMTNMAKVMAQVIVSSNYADTKYFGGNDTNYTVLRNAISGFQQAVEEIKPTHE